jgi:hypothetical protein
VTRILSFIISLIRTTATAASAAPVFGAIGWIGEYRSTAPDVAGRIAVLLLAVAAVREPPREPPGRDQTHATRGTVKSAATDEIVVARSKHRGDITIEVAPATQVDGALRVGAIVSVRYHDEHGKHVATAIAVERPQPPAPVKPGSGATG